MLSHIEENKTYLDRLSDEATFHVCENSQQAQMLCMGKWKFLMMLLKWAWFTGGQCMT